MNIINQNLNDCFFEETPTQWNYAWQGCNDFSNSSQGRCVLTMARGLGVRLCVFSIGEEEKAKVIGNFKRIPYVQWPELSNFIHCLNFVSKALQSIEWSQCLTRLHAISFRFLSFFAIKPVGKGSKSRPIEAGLSTEGKFKPSHPLTL